MEQDEKCVCEMSFKRIAIEIDDDQKFDELVSEAIEKVRTRLREVRQTLQAEKTAIIEGQPTLSEKGVEVSVGVKFG